MSIIDSPSFGELLHTWLGALGQMSHQELVAGSYRAEGSWPKYCRAELVRRRKLEGDGSPSNSVKTEASRARAAEWTPVAELKPWVKNPRKNDHRVPEAVRSLKRFGFGAPIVAWRSKGEIVAGHARLKATLAILKDEPSFAFPDAPGPGFVPVRFVEFLSAAEAAAYALRDNNPLGEWDETLPYVLAELEREGAELDGLGWSDDEIKRMTSAANGDSDGAEDQTGDLTNSFDVIITCSDEREQRRVIELAQHNGLQCRALT